jgi:hypothetical protein
MVHQVRYKQTGGRRVVVMEASSVLFGKIQRKAVRHVFVFIWFDDVTANNLKGVDGPGSPSLART